MRRVDERVAPLAVDLAPPGLELLAHDREVRQPEDETGTELLVDAEELELLPEHAVVAALDLLKALQVIVELLLVGPHRAVDALQLRVALVAAPVRAGDGEELERADLSGALDVRSLAEIDESIVLVDAHAPVLHLVVAVFVRAVLCELFDLVDLVVLVPFAEERERLGHAHHAMLERRVLLHDIAHLRLDLAEVIGRERARKIEVVVETVRDRRPESELRTGEKIEDGAGHDVRGRVPQRVELFVAVVGFALGFWHGPPPNKNHLRPSGTRGDLAVPPSFAGLPTGALR